MKRKKNKLSATEMFSLKLVASDCPYGCNCVCRDCYHYGGTKDFGNDVKIFCNYKRNVEKQRIADNLRKITLCFDF